MFETLSDRLNETFGKLNRKGRLTEQDVDNAMREVRRALLEADVNFKVVKDFVASVRERAARAFRLLGEAEGRIHGVPAEQVALHEVGAADAMVDIVGALEGFERLGVSRVYNWPVTVGAGWVRAAHGVIPVPAPATAVLLEGIELGPNGPVTGEATTPTGAVLLRVLSSGPPPARWRPVSAGAWGAGGRNPSEYPNALRLILAQPVNEAGEVVLLAPACASFDAYRDFEQRGDHFRQLVRGLEDR